MLLEILTICMLTHTTPFYDCNNMMTIELYDDKYLDVQCENKFTAKFHVLGCAYYSKHPIYDVLYPPVIKVGSSKYIDKWGQTTLEHELRHIDCRCKWRGHP